MSHPLRIAMLPLGLSVFAGCTTQVNPGTVFPDNAASLRRMASCDDLKTRLEDSYVEMLVDNTYGYYGRGGVFAEDDVAVADSAGGDGAEASAPTDYTTTNVQEQGVDELDMIKMVDEGRLMLVAQDRGLHVVDTWPIDEARKRATVELDGFAHGLFAVGDKAVVFQWIRGQDAGWPGEEWRSLTRMTVVDFSDADSPVIEREVDMDGWVADARMVDGDVYFVMNQYMEAPQEIWEILWGDNPVYRPDFEWDYEDQDALDALREQMATAIRPHVRAVLDAHDVQDFLPSWRTGASEDISGMYACSDIYVPQQNTALAMLSVGSFDPNNGSLQTTGLMSQGWTIYASKKNLYVAQTSNWWWGWSADAVSHIHKFTLRGDAPPAYTASGEVTGWMYDQFAMSEYDGFLRAVTTDFGIWNWWGDETDEERPDPANNIFVLEDEGAGELNVVGHVGGIAPNEQVQAVRMMGEKGYVVTFERIDPLFTLDLSDPYNPIIAGELKIPGFSAYLHPLGPDHLLAVGMAGLDTGELTGVAVNVFDVSDMANPSLAHTHEIANPGPGWNWSWSEALWDHHAFTFGRDTLTIPVMLESYDQTSQTWDGFSGTISFDIDTASGISEVGRVDHSDLVDDSMCLYSYWDGWDVSWPCSYREWGWWGSSRVRRSAYVEDNLFTVSSLGVKVTDLADPGTTHAEILFYPQAN